MFVPHVSLFFCLFIRLSCYTFSFLFLSNLISLVSLISLSLSFSFFFPLSPSVPLLIFLLLIALFWLSLFLFGLLFLSRLGRAYLFHFISFQFSRPYFTFHARLSHLISLSLSLSLSLRYIAFPFGTSMSFVDGGNWCCLATPEWWNRISGSCLHLPTINQVSVS